MPDRFQADSFCTEPPQRPEPHPPLPPWLADRLLADGEEVTWVRGPRFNPPWERHVTHPALFLVALAFAGALLIAGWLATGMEGLPAVPTMAALGIVLGSIYVLGFCSGYFTRLVVTNRRLFIVQGYELCHSWSIDDLPRSLIRYSPLQGGEASRSVDLANLRTMLGGSSSQFSEAKTILAFSKELGQIKAREKGRP